MAKKKPRVSAPRQHFKNPFRTHFCKRRNGPSALCTHHFSALASKLRADLVANTKSGGVWPGPVKGGWREEGRFTLRADLKSGMVPDPDRSYTSESRRTKDPVTVRTYLSESLKLEARGFYNGNKATQNARRGGSP